MSGTPISITGNLTADPELKYTAEGRAVARMTVAVTDRTRQADGTWTDGETAFYSVTAFGGLAERAAECLTKGARVIVAGRQGQRHWTTPEGESRSAWTVTADDIGASMLFASVTVARAARRSAGQVPADDQWATATPARPVSPAPQGRPAR